tara:strand:- start:850 stop:1239 length:390 start_codon:yes stop_codon:yes gene_type:complete
MNIFGIGTDIINISRIKKSLKSNKRLKKKIFTNYEINACEKRKNKTECYAKRFAAKEALFKAIRTDGVLKFQDVEVRNDKNGAPAFNIKNSSKIKLNKKFKKKKYKIFLSLSDDKPWAVATAIIFVNSK